MSKLKIPTVTIDDLQAFQAKHFPGHKHWIVSDHAKEYELEDSMPDDDGLGCYPGGVKRTLTDEQIKIFRHSEIHALLREKQLREEEFTEEERPLGESEQPISDVEPTLEARREDNILEEATQEVSARDGEKSQQPSLTTRPLKSDLSLFRRNNNARATTSAPSGIDYGDGDEAASELPLRETPASDSHFSGRKIVSYND